MHTYMCKHTKQDQLEEEAEIMGMHKSLKIPGDIAAKYNKSTVSGSMYGCTGVLVYVSADRVWA
jgi:hypothetical protein